MSPRNTIHDIWKSIDMSAGDDACWPWKLVPGGGKGRGKPRPYFSLHGKKIIATRLVYVMVTGDELGPNDMICHSCDNSLCCNPRHIYKGDHKSNTQDMVDRDRHGLPSHVVRRIRVLLSRGGQTHREIAALYGIDRSIVTKINNDVIHTHAGDYPTAEDHLEDGEHRTHKDT